MPLVRDITEVKRKRLEQFQRCIGWTFCVKGAPAIRDVIQKVDFVGGKVKGIHLDYFPIEYLQLVGPPEKKNPA